LLAALALAVAGLLWAFARGSAETPGDAAGVFGAGRADAVSGGAPATLVDGAEDSGEISVARGARERVAVGLRERSDAGEKQHAVQTVDAVTVPFRVRVAAFAEVDMDGLELDFARILGNSSNESWFGAVPLERDGAAQRAPRSFASRALPA